MNYRRIGLVLAVLLGAAALYASRSMLQEARWAGGGVGSFDLVDAQGHSVTERSLQGRPYAVFFGFTHCPELCAASLSRLAALRQMLGPDAQRLDVLFVGVDPDRDAPAQLGRFVARFDPAVRALTGNASQVARVARLFRVEVRRVPYGDAGDYTIVHTATIFLVDPHGRLVDAISTTTSQTDALSRIRSLLQRPS